MTSRIVFNDKEFRKGLKRIGLRQSLKAAEVGMGQAALQLMGDAILIEPTVPLKTGRLRGSGTAFTQNKLAGDSEEQVVPREGQIKGQPTPARSFDVPIKSNAIVGVVLFNTEYAWEVHELQPVGWNRPPGEGGRATPFHEPTSDIKWLSNKMFAFQKKYFGIVRNEVARVLGG